jgi:GDP-L-fucose synthase
MKKILILGGFGFMGKNINKVFAGDDKYVIINESRRTGCDLTDFPQFLLKLKSIQPDIIIYAAAKVGSINYVGNHCAEVIHENSQMYLNLYKAVSKVNKGIQIINIISNCSYPGIIDVQDEVLWWSGEIHPSVESYGMSKKLGFVLSECYKKQYGIQTLNLIVPNAYGENDYADSEKLHALNGIIMRMIQAKKRGDKEFIVWGTGLPIREWVYMPDIGRLLKYVIDEERYDLPNPINIGQEQGVSILELVNRVKKILKYHVKVICDVTKQDGAPVKVLGGKLFKIYFPDFRFTDYEEGIQNTIKYYESKTTNI